MVIKNKTKLFYISNNIQFTISYMINEIDPHLIHSEYFRYSQLASKKLAMSGVCSLPFETVT